jgi:carboxyl-terminal processing protease
VEEEKTPTLLYYLLNDYVLFDFITGYVQKHKTLAPIETFALTDEDFEDFKQYAKEKNFSYDRQSEKILKNLKEVAHFEGYLEESDSTTLQKLESKLTPDIERDFERFKELIKKVMAAEIVKRYYFEKGELIQNLKDDPVLEKALDVLTSPELVDFTLNKSGSGIGHNASIP